MACGRRVDYIIHCAGSIRFDLPIHDTMRQNYSTTANLMSMARKHMDKLKCFAYCSTAFVNFNQPERPAVEEKLYSLDPGTPWQDDIVMAERLIALPQEQAIAEVGSQTRQCHYCWAENRPSAVCVQGHEDTKSADLP